ncbi:MAG: nicotinate (nicotinamide) nucleotide adenylyltransferase [Lachnospiraceae bacterium]|nr:nicotinate (nicotinamide) nucleotide adenylyltransferase [Lachnospiraceae bacterium]
MAGKKVAIMSGYFNPVHLGHLLIAENAYETVGLDEVLFIPTTNIPDGMEMPDIWTRIEITGTSIEDNSHFALSTIEADKGGKSQPYETVEALKAKYPQNEYYFIVGGDTLMKMDKWECVDKIFADTIILVARRVEVADAEMDARIEEYKNKYGARIQILPIEYTDLYSAKIRERVKAGRSIRYMVHYKAVEYIKKHKLYISEQ